MSTRPQHARIDSTVATMTIPARAATKLAGENINNNNNSDANGADLIACQPAAVSRLAWRPGTLSKAAGVSQSPQRAGTRIGLANETRARRRRRIDARKRRRGARLSSGEKQIDGCLKGRVALPDRRLLLLLHHNAAHSRKLANCHTIIEQCRRNPISTKLTR